MFIKLHLRCIFLTPILVLTLTSLIYAQDTSDASSSNEFLIYAPSRISNGLVIVAAKSYVTGLKLDSKSTVSLGLPATTIVQHPKSRLLYVAAAKRDKEGNSQGAVITLDESGNYQSHQVVEFLGGYCYLSFDRSNRWLMGVDYGTGRVDVYELDDDGLPSNGKTVLDEDRRNAHCVLPSPDNRFVYIPYVKDNNALLQFAFDSVSGTLTPLDPNNANPPVGTGPRHLAYHPSEPIVYFSNEQTPGASAYAINKNGTLELKQVCNAFGPDQDTTGTSSSDIALTPDGKFLFVGVRGRRQSLDSVARFEVLSDGTLKRLGVTKVDEVPWGMTFSPDGKYLLVSAFHGASLTMFAIGEKGELDKVDRLEWDRQVSDLVTGR